VSLPISRTSQPQQYELALAPHIHRYTEARQTVTGFLPKEDGLQKALTGADVVVIPAGIPRKSDCYYCTSTTS
jgi:hypothetical protein